MYILRVPITIRTGDTMSTHFVIFNYAVVYSGNNKYQVLVTVHKVLPAEKLCIVQSVL